MKRWYRVTERAVAEGHYYVEAESADEAYTRAFEYATTEEYDPDAGVLFTGVDPLPNTYKIVGRAKRVDGPPEWLFERDEYGEAGT